MTSLESEMQAKLSERADGGLLRRLPPPLTERIDFCSNDYLGFARNLAVTATHSGGATGSRLISGNSLLAETLETEIAAFHRAKAALLFSSGYAANIGMLPALVRRADTIVYDRLLHASLRDGIRLSRATALRFAHNDLEDLRKQIQRATGRIFVVVESVYSMDGDQAPLAEMVALCEEYHAELIVDEAHGTGVVGEHGVGLVSALGLEDSVLARVHTFGKAIGSHGAAVIGSKVLREYLINFARSFIYATGLPEHTLASIRAAYQALTTTDQVAELRERVRFFLAACSPAVRRRLLPSSTPVQALIQPGNTAVTALAAALQAQNFAVLPIRSPTVPAGQERIRICLHTFNTDAEITGLVDALERYFG